MIEVCPITALKEWADSYPVRSVKYDFMKTPKEWMGVVTVIDENNKERVQVASLPFNKHAFKSLKRALALEMIIDVLKV